MFNLLRMDLYRMKRSKSVYVSFAILVAVTILCFWMLWIVGTSQGQAYAFRSGMNLTVTPGEEIPQLEDYDSLTLFREVDMDGGTYSIIIGILTAIFVCLDFNSGFMKNIMALHPDRWKYIAAKMMSVGILNIVLLTLHFLFCCLMNSAWGPLVPFAGLKDILPYMASAWVNTTAFSAMIILVCMLTRSTAAGVMAALLLGSGVIHTLLYQLTSLFGLTGWYEYTLYYNTSYIPASFTSLADWKGTGIALVYLALYSALSMLALTKRDI